MRRVLAHLFVLALAAVALLAQSSREAALKNGLASGGLWKTVNGGTTWEPVFDNEETSSIGSVAVAQSDPAVVWVGTGEANNRQSSSWGNGVYRSLHAGKTWQNMGLKDTHHVPRIMIHPRNPNVVFVAAQGHLWGPNRERGVFKTTDGGKTWTQVLFINEDTGVNDLRMDPENPDTLYASAYQRRRTPWGFNGGGPGSAIHKTIDGGATWTKLTKGLPQSGDLGRIALEIYRHDSNVAFDGHRGDDFNPYLFMTTDYGETWAGISKGLPRDNSTLHAIREHPRNQNLLFAGTEHGLFISFDRGKNWQKLKNNLPTVPVDDIQIHSRDNDLILGTHGRSIWVLDDINALEEMTDRVLASDLQLFDVRPTISWRVSNTKGNVGQDFFVAPNPPYGAIVEYYLKSKPARADDLKITILDRDGKQVRELRNPPGEEGINRAVWDLRYDPPAEPPRETDEGEGGPPPPRGPIAEPGEYTVRISLGSLQMTKKVTVEEDLRVKMPPADRNKRRQTITELYAMAQEAEQNRIRFTSLRDSVTKLKDSWKAAGAPRAADSAQKALDDFDKKLDGISGRFVLPPEGRARGKKWR